MRTKTAMAILLAVVGMLAIGGAWSSASADPGNGNGANQSGPFDPTDPNQGTNQGHSGNGNGTVGNADDKNPPGQVDNEHSNGYECNGNKGVGDKGGNPAHTGCAEDTSGCTNPDGCDGGCTNPDGCDGGCTNPNGCDGNPGCTSNCGGVTQTPGETPEAEVLGLTEDKPADAAVAAAPTAAVQANELARTGSTAETMGFVALALFAFGGSAILFGRREEHYGHVA